MEKFQGKLTKIIGDASFRQFYRLKKDGKTTIIVKTMIWLACLRNTVK